MLLSIDPTLGYKQIKAMKEEAMTLRHMTSAAPLRQWLDEFIAECKIRLPSHKCWIEGDNGQYLVIKSLEDNWQYIVLHVEFEFEDAPREEREQVAFACCKRYELKDQIEPASYNQSPPGLYLRYQYLMKIRISHETWLELTKLHIEQLVRSNKKRDVKEE